MSNTTSKNYLVFILMIIRPYYTRNLKLLQTICQAGLKYTTNTALEFWPLSIDFHQHATGLQRLDTVYHNPGGRSVAVQDTCC